MPLSSSRLREMGRSAASPFFLRRFSYARDSIHVKRKPFREYLSKTAEALFLAVAALAVAVISDMMGYTTIAAQAIAKGDKLVAAHHEANAK